MKPLSERQKQLAYRWLVDGPLRPVAKPLYLALLRAELAAHAAMDVGRAGEITGVTAIIKTFERPDRCAQLIRSIRRRYPRMPVIVVDDSRHPVEHDDVVNLSMPYDSGVSAGRRLALAHVETEFLINLDDDRVFFSGTKVEAAMAAMRQHRQIDIMGGRVIDLPLYISHDLFGVPLFDTAAGSLLPPGSRIGPFRVQDKVENFFLARTERLRLVDWDVRLKRLDHADFFTRAKGVLLTVHNPELAVLHVRDPFAAHYRQKRYDLDADFAHLRDKYRTPWRIS